MFSFFLILGFSSKRPHDSSKQFLTFEDCSGTFSQHIKKNNKTDINQIITAYKVFPCFPLDAIDFMITNHKASKWAMSELSKQRVIAPLSLQGDLKLRSTLLPYVKQRSDKEKFLIKIINLKNKLGLSSKNELDQLHLKFPSHNPNRLQKPDLSVVRDLKRRGQNLKALSLLKKIKKRRPYDLKVQKTLVSTQKNIARNADYLNFSQSYVNSVYSVYKKKR